MKICIPAEDNKGLESNVYGHFGSAPYFLIFDTEAKTSEFLKNAEDHEHGQCVPVGRLMPHNISAVLCGGIGAGAASKLNAAGMKVYKGEAETLEKMLEIFNTGKMPELDVNDCCKGHSH